MLAPEVEKFDPPKIITRLERFKNINFLVDKISRDSFYESIVVTIPDEIQIPVVIQESILEDNDYYKLSKCPLTEFFEPSFIEYFIKKGKMHSLTLNRNCIVENCAAISPDGVLSLHLLKFVYEMLGIQGQKQNHGFMEVNIDLKNLRQDVTDKIKQSPLKDELFDFSLIWEPDSEDICPSSIAKYFNDRGLQISVCSTEIKFLNPIVKQVPALEEIDEVVEWIGMLAHNLNMEQEHTYISTYEEPITDNPLVTNNISLLIVKGFLTSTVVEKVCRSIAEYVSTRDIYNYWAGLSYQSCDNSPWSWDRSSKRMFQAFDCCTSIFVTQNDIIRYVVGQLKYT